MASRYRKRRPWLAVCVFCGNSFETRCNKAKYCPGECRKKARLSGVRASYHRNSHKYRANVRAYHKRYYAKNREKIILKTKAYQKTPAGKAAIAKSYKNHCAKFPEKVRARYELMMAMRRGEVIKKPCVVCGDSKSEGHHRDYNKPLDVVWLCQEHHKQFHVILKSKNNVA